MKVIITSGYFNPLHIGHVSLIKEAKKLGDFLVVIVNNDNQVKLKGSISFMPEQERIEIIKALRYADEVFLSIDDYPEGAHVPISKSLEAIAKKYQEAELFFAKGGDRHAGNIPESEREVCEKYNIRVVSGVGGGKIQSSSWLIKNAKKDT
jgi:D-beta-D-heptose 7-phosphate kinase/D-beta-D-heptose 1-phosphate adenosyltransferase